MAKQKWLRVRITDEQDEKLEHYAANCGLSRSELIRQIIEAMPHEPTSELPKFDKKFKKREPIMKEYIDSFGNNYMLSVEYRNSFNLWRISLRQLDRFNHAKFTAGIDLVKEVESSSEEIWLNMISPCSSDSSEEINVLLWDTVKQLASQEGWKKLYGELTLGQIERRPKMISWLKEFGFGINSHPEQENLSFSKVI
ncbi:MAG: ribbon-helix-helix domain-containing protein [Microcystaceae cyanobacterium]